MTSYPAARAAPVTPCHSACSDARGGPSASCPRHSVSSGRGRPSLVALSILGLAVAVGASVGAVGMDDAATVAAAPRGLVVVSSQAEAMESRSVQFSRGQGRPARGENTVRFTAPPQDAEQAARAVAIRHRELKATAAAIDREARRLADVADQRELAVRKAERARAAEASRSAFVWPTAGGVSSGFGFRIHPILKTRKLHNGADIGGACGQPIVAVRSGVVTRAQRSGSNGGAGHNVRILHGTAGGAELETAYLHLDDVEVKMGQRVRTGQRLGTVGSTGLSTACHLHLSLYKDGVGRDPLAYVRK